MQRIVFILFMACVLQLMPAIGSAAEGNKPIAATVSAVDVVANTVSVAIAAEDGTTTTKLLTVGEKTRIKVGRDEAELAAVLAGASVKVKFKEADDGSNQLLMLQVVVPKEPKEAKEPKEPKEPKQKKEKKAKEVDDDDATVVEDDDPPMDEQVNDDDQGNMLE